VLGKPPADPATKPLKALTVRGTLDKHIIRRVIRKRVKHIQFCFEKQLVRDPHLAGRIDVNFTIGPTGKVMSAKVRASTIGIAEMKKCVLDVVKRMRFPKPHGGDVVEVNYPFIFKTTE
jgi:TonB family protein